MVVNLHFITFFCLLHLLKILSFEMFASSVRHSERLLQTRWGKQNSERSRRQGTKLSRFDDDILEIFEANNKCKNMSRKMTLVLISTLFLFTQCSAQKQPSKQNEAQKNKAAVIIPG